MTVTEVPADRAGVEADSDAAQLLFQEARQRRRRRRLVGGVITMALVALVAIGLVAGVALGRGGTPSRPVPQPAVVTPVAAVPSTTLGFSIRPVLCYATAYSVAPGRSPATGPLPACSAPSELTPANLAVDTATGVTANSPPEDARFAAYPSTTATAGSRDRTVLLPGGPAGGPDRYVLGPAGLTRDAVAHARVTSVNGQWAVDLSLTDRGAARWNAFAEREFHAVVGVVIDGRVVSAPITEPTQATFASFDGQLQISGSFTHHQAEVFAAGL